MRCIGPTRLNGWLLWGMTSLFKPLDRIEIQRQLIEAGLDPAPREGTALAEAAKGDQARLQAMLARRLQGEPLAYVLGFQPFWSRDWPVSPAVLIPRPDSEVLVQSVLGLLPPGEVALVAEAGVGSGAILGSVLLERPAIRGVGTELYPAALAVAEANLREAGVLGRCTLHLGSWFAGIAGTEGPFRVMFANPPYIGAADYARLEPTVRGWEPKTALLADEDGLACYRPLALQAWDCLEQGGWLVLEIGATQAEAVREILQRQGFGQLTIRPDLAGRPRVVMGQK